MLIEDRDGAANGYGVFHWSGPPVPLNQEHSTPGPGGPITEVFRRDAVQEMHVFGVADGLLTLVVSDVVRQRLQALGATGMVAERAPVA